MGGWVGGWLLVHAGPHPNLAALRPRSAPCAEQLERKNKVKSFVRRVETQEHEFAAQVGMSWPPFAARRCSGVCDWGSHGGVGGAMTAPRTLRRCM